MTNIFEQASRLGLRFNSTKGTISTEDLWQLSLESLDTLARGLNKELKESSEESFIQKRTTANRTLELRFEIVKHVIGVRLAEKEKRAKAAENATKRAELQELINKKHGLAREGKSIEELQAEMDALED
jgi:hypothetical protein